MLGTLTHLSTAIWIYDINNHRINWANNAALSMWESDSLEELCLRDFKSSASPAVTQALISYQKLFEQGQKFSLFWRYTPKGVTKEAFCQFSAHTLPDGSMGMLVEAVPSYLIQEHTAITSPIALSSFRERTGGFISANISFIEQMGDSVKQLNDVFTRAQDYQTLLKHIKKQTAFIQDVRLNTFNGSKWFSINASLSKDHKQNSIILLQLYDIHDRKINEFELQRQSLKDPLTGLLNRKGLHKQIDECTQNNQEILLFYIDLDGFKLINDTFGHGIGDELLISFSQKLESFHEGKGVASRIGGDEFIWFIELNTTDINEQLLGEMMVSFLCESYKSSLEIPIMVSASLGGAKIPENGNNFDELLMAADIAMYRAKQQGRRRCVMYHNNMTKQVARQNQLVQCLHQAIKRDELELYYQPIYDLNINEIIYFESLLRWNNQDLGWVMPCETIQIAEDMGFICELENWVIKQALKDLVILKKHYSPALKMSINISGIHVSDKELTPFIKQSINELGLNYSDLIIELTESVLVENTVSQNNCLQQLIALGIDINIDDFGTGYSSLAYIHEIPASTVKIDRLFVKQAMKNKELVKSLYKLIKSLDMNPLIEGIESQEQKELFNCVGIQLQQGFYHGKPQPLEFYKEHAKSLLKK